MMPSSFFSNNVRLMTLLIGSLTSNPTKFVFLIAPSPLRNFNKHPHLPMLMISLLSLTPSLLTIQPKLAAAAKKGSLTTQTTTALRPSVPLQPRQPQVVSTASSSTSPPPAAQSPIPPAASSFRPSPTMPDVSHAPPTPPFVSAPAAQSRSCIAYFFYAWY